MQGNRPLHLTFLARQRLHAFLTRLRISSGALTSLCSVATGFDSGIIMNMLAADHGAALLPLNSTIHVKGSMRQLHFLLES